MNRLDSENKNSKKVDQNKQFEKILRISLIIAIVVISGFIVYYLLTPESGYVTFGILNSEKEAENYPTNSTVGQNVSFYISVGNYLKRDFSFRVEILRGDNNTILSPEGSSFATSVLNITDTTLKNKIQWTSSMLNVSFSVIGSNQTIIAELWEVDRNFFESFIMNTWLRLNITS